MTTLFALVDCNNFFVSCERVFRPDLNGRPVVVLSNNDYIVISRSNEAKALGIRMGAPIWEVEKLLKSNNGVVCSSNYELYGDMSMRVMSILKTFAPGIDIYSIDESFLDLSGMNDYTDTYQLGKDMVKTILKNTGIPVSVGIDNTKTLAKACSRYAKKHPENQGVCFVETENDREAILSFCKIEDIWGIGKHTAAFLQNNNIITAQQFAEKDFDWVSGKLNTPGIRTWYELRGTSCITIDNINSTKKQICTSRSFGNIVTDMAELTDAVSYFAARCSKKLREQKSYAKSMVLFFIVVNNDNITRFMPSRQIFFPVATNSELEITKAAVNTLESMFNANYKYKKAGVIITEIFHGNFLQQDLFDTVDREKHQNLMTVMDKINDRIGMNKVHLASMGNSSKWKMKREHLSKRYSTNIDDIIEVGTD